MMEEKGTADLPIKIPTTVVLTEGSTSTGMDGAAVTAGFGPSTMLTPETEQTALLNPFTPVGGFPFSVKGSKSGLAEGLHVITLLGKAITGGNATVSGTALQTSLEIRIPQ